MRGAPRLRARFPLLTCAAGGLPKRGPKRLCDWRQRGADYIISLRAARRVGPPYGDSPRLIAGPPPSLACGTLASPAPWPHAGHPPRRSQPDPRSPATASLPARSTAWSANAGIQWLNRPAVVVAGRCATPRMFADEQAGAGDCGKKRILGRRGQARFFQGAGQMLWSLTQLRNSIFIGGRHVYTCCASQSPRWDKEGEKGTFVPAAQTCRGIDRNLVGGRLLAGRGGPCCRGRARRPRTDSQRGGHALYPEADQDRREPRHHGR